MIGASQLNPNLWWYFARAGGLVAWALLAASVFWGLLYSGRLTRNVPRPAWNLDLHRFLGGLSVIFVTIHVTALMADKYVDFGVAQVLVPFASRWRPGAVAWGITAFYLLLAVEATSLAMRWLPRPLWRRVHLTSFGLFAFSTVHAVQTGTDTANPLVRGIGICLLAVAVVTAVLRVAQARRRAATRAQPPSAASPGQGAEVAAPPEPVAIGPEVWEDIARWLAPPAQPRPIPDNELSRPEQELLTPDQEPLIPYRRPPKVHRYPEPPLPLRPARVVSARPDIRVPR